MAVDRGDSARCKVKRKHASPCAASTIMMTIGSSLRSWHGQADGGHSSLAMSRGTAPSTLAEWLIQHARRGTCNSSVCFRGAGEAAAGVCLLFALAVAAMVMVGGSRANGGHHLLELEVLVGCDGSRRRSGRSGSSRAKANRSDRELSAVQSKAQDDFSTSSFKASKTHSCFLSSYSIEPAPSIFAHPSRVIEIAIRLKPHLTTTTFRS